MLKVEISFITVELCSSLHIPLSKQKSVHKICGHNKHGALLEFDGVTGGVAPQMIQTQR